MTAEYAAGSKLEKIFKSGQKAVTGECGPPAGPTPTISGTRPIF